MKKYKLENGQIIEFTKDGVLLKGNSISLRGDIDIIRDNNEASISEVFGNAVSNEVIDLNENESDRKVVPARELIVFTNNGQTYHFENVTNFRPTTTGFSFTYHGKATGIDRDAVFNNTSAAGWAFADQH